MIARGIAISVAALVVFYPCVALTQQVELSSEAGRGSPVAVANAETPDGRPDAVHAASAGGKGGRRAPAGRVRSKSPIVEPPDGRAFEARPIRARTIGPPSAPAPAVASGTSTIGELKGPANDVKQVEEANGREAPK